MAGLLSRLNTAEERLSDYAHINRESESRKAKRSNFERKTEPNMQGLWENCRQDSVPGGKAEHRLGVETLFQTIVTENHTKLVPDTGHWIQTSQNTLRDNYSFNLYLDILFL